MGKFNKKLSPAKKESKDPVQKQSISEKSEKPQVAKPKVVQPDPVTELSTKKKIHKKLHEIKKDGNQKGIKKKDKKQFKKQEMLKMIELTKKDFKEEKKRKNREKTAITGDMKPLLDSLPSLDTLFSIQTSLKSRVPPNHKPPTKRQKKVLWLAKQTEDSKNRCAQLLQIMNDPNFKKNPREALAEKIRQRRLQEQQELQMDL